jgi:hypothetical protein
MEYSSHVNLCYLLQRHGAHKIVMQARYRAVWYCYECENEDVPARYVLDAHTVVNSLIKNVSLRKISKARKRLVLLTFYFVIQNYDNLVHFLNANPEIQNLYVDATMQFPVILEPVLNFWGSIAKGCGSATEADEVTSNFLVV